MKAREVAHGAGGEGGGMGGGGLRSEGVEEARRLRKSGETP